MKDIKRVGKFRTGDYVTIVNYGHLIMSHRSQAPSSFPVIEEDGDTLYIDLMPEIVGMTAIISTVTQTQGEFKYSIQTEKGYSAWYSENQLRPIMNAIPDETLELIKKKAKKMAKQTMKLH